MNKEFTQICREILALGDMIRNSGLNEQLIAGSVEEARQIKEQIEKIRDQILAHTGGDGISEESLNEIKNELNLKLSIAAAEALYVTKEELPSIDGLLSNENAEATYLKIEAADTKFATKEELTAASLGGGSGGENSAAIRQLQNSINVKLGKDEAEGIYAKISQIPSVEGLLSTQTAEETYLKKVDKPNIDNLATKAELENYATKEQIPDVGGFITQTQGDERYALKGQGDGNGSGLDPDLFLQKNDAESMYAKKASVEVLENGKLGKSEKATDSALFNGNSEEMFVKHSDTSETATNLSVVKRTANGSIVATDVNVSGNLNLADTQTEDGALVSDAHIVFSEATGKALMRGSVNKLKQLVTPDLSGYLASNAADVIYAKKGEIPNLSGYLQTSAADNRYQSKSAMSGYLTTAAADGKYALRSQIPNLSGYLTQNSADLRYEKKGQGGLSAEINKSENGYIKFSNGLILQWGVTGKFGGYTDYRGGDKKTLFPIAFPNTLLQVSCTVMASLENESNTSPSSANFSVCVGKWDKTGMFILASDRFPTSDSVSDYYNNRLKIKYIAIGY
ncbi:hypothetical protein [Campylobacter sp. RM16188]|uniref:gp53-like domain-containing protein n=1 Tax=Campylobacter sp. RM16188 TaxID=1705725 RepID=UPI0015530B94|nr:hypothetical protein [Campylobacter sp. RM16188]